MHSYSILRWKRSALDETAEGRLSGCGAAEDGMWTVEMLVTVL